MKPVTCFLFAAALILCIATGGRAATNRCTVIESRANILVLRCQTQNISFQAGTKVKIKTARKDGPAESPGRTGRRVK